MHQTAISTSLIGSHMCVESVGEGRTPRLRVRLVVSAQKREVVATHAAASPKETSLTIACRARVIVREK